MPKGWEPLGSGTFNNVYKSDDGKSVLKIQKITSATDLPERSVRLWNEINPNLPPPARIQETEDGQIGWVCPFVTGTPAKDDEIKEALITIYNNTGRIVVDATALSNFVRTPHPNSQVVCVDIGMALQMQQKEEVLASKMVRRNSFVSLDVWKTLNTAYTDFFENSKKDYPKTIEIVKALIFINNNRPDIFNVTFLKEQPNLVTKFAQAYDKQSPINDFRGKTPVQIGLMTPPLVVECKQLLDNQRPFITENIKESLNKQLQRYIDSRGKINTEGVFEPSLITKIFRNSVLTNTKITAIKELMDNITKSDSYDDISKLLMESITANAKLPEGLITHGFAAAVSKCRSIIGEARYQLNLEHQKNFPTSSP